MGALFSAIVITEATLVTTCTHKTVSLMPFSPICDVDAPPTQVIYFV